MSDWAEYGDPSDTASQERALENVNSLQGVVRPQVDDIFESAQKWQFWEDWIVEASDVCTCGGPAPYGHEPSCGVEPIVQLSGLRGWQAFLREVKEGKHDG